MSEHITIPKPQIHTGPAHQTVDEATAAYLREAASRVRTRQIWGSGVSRLVADLLDSSADAVMPNSSAPEASAGVGEGVAS